MAGPPSATASPAPRDPIDVVAGLVVIVGDVADVRPLAADSSVILGRADTADVVLAHRSVSRHHARITHLDGVIRVTDLQSRNGVVVNGARLADGVSATLATGDVVALGDAQVLVTALPRTSGEAFRALADEVEALERRRLREALDATGGVQLHAARLLGVPRRTFIEKLKRLGIRP